MQEEIDGMQKNLEKEKIEMERMRREARAPNSIFSKILDNDEHNVNLRTTMINIINQINQNITRFDVVSVHRLGREPGNGPVLVCFASKQVKNLLFNNLQEIIDMGLTLSDDRSPEERKKEKT